MKLRTNENTNSPFDVFNSIQDVFYEMVVSVSFAMLEEFIVKNIKGTFGIIGVGKNYITAQRIAATFNSLGIHTFPINAENALHGELAHMHSMSAIIAISKSGMTSTLNKVLFEIDGYAPKYGFTMNKKDCDLDGNCLRVIRPQFSTITEFDAYNLLPTASTVVFQMVGEWLAYKAFSFNKDHIDDFLKMFHPGE